VIQKEFSATDTLNEVKSYVLEFDQSCRNCSFRVPFLNNIVYSTGHFDSSLENLELVPNATLIVTMGLKKTTNTNNNTNQTQEAKPWFFTRIFNWACNQIGWTNNENNENTVRTNNTNNNEGGIHTLRRSEDEDKEDKNKYWNGNSTQQM